MSLDMEGEAAQRPHIVVVDDDPELRELLVGLLKECGYQVSGASGGAELNQVVNAHAVDLILLDVMLDEKSGLQICEDFRRRSDVPIILISARGLEPDRVTGLDLGADDYIAKPFGGDELLARIRAVLRRANASHLPADLPPPDLFEFAGWRYLPRRGELVGPSGAQVELTVAEHELLLGLLRNPRRVVTRERLERWTRGRAGVRAGQGMDAVIGRLRRKIGGHNRQLIRNVRGTGHLLAADVESR